ncbi:MAG: hypothetical protein QNJ60_08890 [Xenococcaceae cyanobacterium MO_188.B19]|nr:hypothetical protein [Xenococcaceae cyanobacterium MO_188.B19]
MQNKQKVTLYIPPELHRKLKIRAAIDTESMSALVQKAISFYLQYPEQVEQIETSTQGNVHQVHICPECEAAVVMRDGEMISLKNQPGVIEEELPLPVKEGVAADQLHGEEELVPC